MTKRKKQKTEPEEKCPSCGSENILVGYGLAAGGIGVYKYCDDCAHFFDSVQDLLIDEPNKR